MNTFVFVLPHITLLSEMFYIHLAAEIQRINSRKSLAGRQSQKLCFWEQGQG